MVASKRVVIEVAGPNGEQLSFRPLPGREHAIRGRFDMAKVKSASNEQRAKWPVPVPGQHLGVDENGNGFIREPLYDPEHAAIREDIEQRKKLRLPPEVESFADVDVNTWLFWMAKAVECGLAVVVEGQLPKKFEGTIKRNFIFAPQEPTSTDRLANAIERQTEMLSKLLAKLG